MGRHLYFFLRKPIDLDVCKIVLKFVWSFFFVHFGRESDAQTLWNINNIRKIEIVNLVFSPKCSISAPGH